MSVTVRLFAIALLVPFGIASAQSPAAQAPTIVLSPGSVALAAAVGSGLSAPQLVNITSNAGTIGNLLRTISYAAGQPTGWLKAPLSGTTTPALLGLQGDASLTLPAGTYGAIVTVRSKGAGIAPQTVAVTFTVNDLGPAIGVAGTAALTAPAGSLTPVSLKLDVTNAGGAKLGGLLQSISYPSGETPGWLTAALGGSDAPTKLTLRASPAQNLIGGVHRATVQITSPQATNSPQLVLVTFTLTGVNPAIALSPSSATFIAILGTGTPAPQSVSITNLGGGTADGLKRSITYAAGQPTGWLNAALGGSSAPTTLVLSAVNTGALAPGVYSATVQVTSTTAYNSPQTVAVTLGVGTSPAHLTMTPTVHDFGSVGVGGASAAQAFTITNDGGLPSGPLTPSSGSFGTVLGGLNPGDFRPDPTSSCFGAAGGLAPHTSCDIVFWFTPTAAGARSAGLSLSASPGGNVVAALSGTGTTAQVIIVSPPSHDFGTFGAGLPATTQRFVLTNPLPWPTGPLQPFQTPGLPPAPLIGGPNPGDFYLDPNSSCFQVLSTGLPVSGSCYFDVTFLPTGLGARSATLVFQMTPGGVVQIAFSGNSLATGFLTITPTTKDFGSVGIGGASAAQTFTITNNAPIPSGPLTASSGSFGTVLGGLNPGDFRPDPTSTCAGAAGGLAPHTSCDFVFWFTPTAAGARSAALSLSASPGGTVLAAFSGTGTTAQVIIVTPPARDFGDVGVGLSSPTQRFVLTNPLPWPTGPIQPIGSPGLPPGPLVSGPNPMDFFFDQNSSCAQVFATGLPVGGSCYFDVSFIPQGLGPRSATLGFQMTPGGVVLIPFSGNGMAAQLFTFSPASLDFGTVDVGTTSATQRVRFTYTGVIPSGPIGPAAPAAGDFNAVILPGCAMTTTGTFAPGAICDFDFSFAPKIDGVQTASLTFAANPGGTATLQLSGIGVFRIATLIITPGNHDFGDVVVGQRSAVQWFTVTNLGGADVNLSGMVVTPTGSGDYGLDINSSCILVVNVLASGGSCTIGVFFMPQVTGDIPGTLRVTTFAHDSATASLTGAGTLLPLSITPTAYDFGNVALGMTSNPATFIVSKHANGNTLFAGAALSGPGAADYILDPGTCIDDLLSLIGACQISVSFGPQVAGPRPATLTVTIRQSDGTEYHATATLTGNGVSVLVIAPSSHDFGSVIVGLPAPAVTFTVTNTGNTKVFHNLGLTGPHAADFAIDANSITCAAYLDPGASCTLSMGFTPQAAGLRSATVTVAPGAGGSATLTGTGTTPVQLLTISPALHQFGAVLLGRTAGPETFTLTNPTSVRTGTINSFVLTGTGIADYSVNQDACAGAALDPGASCDFSVTFTPQVAGGHPVTLTVMSTTGEAGATELRGFGSAPAVLTITPNPHDFGFVFPGQTSAPVTFTVTNTGAGISGVINWFNITFSGPDSSNFSFLDTSTCFGPIQLAPGASCTIDVIFFPQAVGLRSATLTVAGNGAGEGTGTATLTGGRTPGGVLTITPTAHDFGPLSISYFSLAGIFTVTNVGTTPAFLFGVEIQEPLLTNYFLEQGSLCQAPFLNPGTSCQLAVRFEPQLPGPLPATLVLTYDAGSVSAALTGTGFFDVLAFSPASFDFGSRAVGATGGVMIFTITNRGSTPTAPLDQVGITGAAAGDFFTSNNLCAGVSLAPGARCTVNVGFIPRALGQRTAIVFVGSSADGSGGGAGLSGTGTATSISAANATSDLLGNPALSPTERVFLDRLGNNNGTYDLGDLLAFLDRNNLKVSPALLRGLARQTERVQ